jgi:hypothetical protein
MRNLGVFMAPSEIARDVQGVFEAQGFGKGSLVPSKGDDPGVRRLILLVLVLALVGSGCGARDEDTAANAKPERPNPNLGKVGRVPTEPFSVGEGKRWIVLIPSADRAGNLCVRAAVPAGSGTQRRCLGPGMPDPVVAFVGLGGPSAKRVDWASLIGLAREDVARVSLQLQSGSPQALELRRWPGFKWQGFSLAPGAGGTVTTDMQGTQAVNRPNELLAFDADGRKLMDLELSWVYGPCERNAGCTGSGKAGRWVDAQDPFVGASGASSEPTARAKEIALRDPLVAKLLAGRRYAFAPSSDWVDCDNSSIGVGLEIHLAEPAEFEEDFPFLTFNHKSGKPYYQAVWHLSVRNASDLLLSVDLRRNQVVEVDPTYSDEVQVLEQKVVKEPEVAPDNLDCDGQPIRD